MRVLIFKLFILSFLIFSCRKGQIDKQSLTLIPAEQVKSAKAWLKSQGESAVYSIVSVEGKSVKISKSFLWDETRILSNGKLSLTPFKLEGTKSDENYQYLLTSFDRSGSVIGEHIITIISSNNKPIRLNEISTDFLALKSIPKDFSGSLIYSDVYDKVIYSYHIQNGKVNSQQDLVITRRGQVAPGNTGTETQNPPPPEGCEYLVVDWYWQTYDENGNLIDEMFLYSTEELFCYNGGGGGGGQGDPQTAEDLFGFISSNANTTIVPLAPTIIFETSTSKNARYKTVVYFNKFVSNGYIGQWEKKITSFDDGTYSVHSDNKWHWDSYQHASMLMEGYSRFYVDFSYQDATGLRNAVLLNGGFGYFSYESAKMDLTYSVKASFIWNGNAENDEVLYEPTYSYSTPLIFTIE